MKKFLSLCLAFCMILCAAAGAAAEDVSIEAKTFPLYYEGNGEDPMDPPRSRFILSTV